MSDNPQTFVQIGSVTVDGNLALPDRTFRNAWALDGDAIVVDMGKARAIQLDKIRAEREPRLAKLDREYMLADEAGDNVGKKAVATKKQVLRDVTADARIAAATTPEELAALTLDVLTE